MTLDDPEEEAQRRAQHREDSLLRRGEEARARQRRRAEGREPSKEESLADLSGLVARAKRLEEEIHEAVGRARRQQATWAEIGKAAGISAQGAHSRWTSDAKDRDRQAKAELRRRAQEASRAQEALRRQKQRAPSTDTTWNGGGELF